MQVLVELVTTVCLPIVVWSSVAGHFYDAKYLHPGWSGHSRISCTTQTIHEIVLDQHGACPKLSTAVLNVEDDMKDDLFALRVESFIPNASPNRGHLLVMFNKLLQLPLRSDVPNANGVVGADDREELAHNQTQDTSASVCPQSLTTQITEPIQCNLNIILLFKVHGLLVPVVLVQEETERFELPAYASRPRCKQPYRKSSPMLVWQSSMVKDSRAGITAVSWRCKGALRTAPFALGAMHMLLQGAPSQSRELDGFLLGKAFEYGGRVPAARSTSIVVGVTK
ncbi:hypothetical protein B0H13DRAFT_1910293 [Mycena leptocephala]|nr:hypothetical protein B0H13DRAFT_1910293 [Mycena leptocephala]